MPQPSKRLWNPEFELGSAFKTFAQSLSRNKCSTTDSVYYYEKWSWNECFVCPTEFALLSTVNRIQQWRSCIDSIRYENIVRGVAGVEFSEKADTHHNAEFTEATTFEQGLGDGKVERTVPDMSVGVSVSLHHKRRTATDTPLAVRSFSSCDWN